MKLVSMLDMVLLMMLANVNVSCIAIAITPRAKPEQFRINLVRFYFNVISNSNTYMYVSEVVNKLPGKTRLKVR